MEKGGISQSSKAISVGNDVIRENSSWLANSLVGKVRRKEDMCDILGLFEACGLLIDTKSARLGGPLVLLSFSNLDSAPKVWKI